MTEKAGEPYQLTEHLFRHSYGKLVAILIRYFGLHQVEVAEDIVQDTLIEAMEKWSIQGVPNNPQGWLMDVAKKKTLNLLKREQLFIQKISPALEYTRFDDTALEDSTLRMIFACCHPDLPPPSQIALALKTLGGLSVSEIAQGLLTTEDNVNKRLYRAKKKLKGNQIDFSSAVEQEKRVEQVISTLYLLFNEGYYSLHGNKRIRIDLCYEAIRLTHEVEASFTSSGQVKSLLALMYLLLARFESRVDQSDDLIRLGDQDRTVWDQQLIGIGITYLSEAQQLGELNSYLLQAGIAAEHALAKDFKSTNWNSVYQQYSVLEKMTAAYSIKLNMCIACFFKGNRDEAIHSLEKVEDEITSVYQVSYYLTLGTLYHLEQVNDKALGCLQKALSISRHELEKEIIQRRLTEWDSM